MSARQAIVSAFLALLSLVSGALNPVPGWAQTFTSGGANVAGQAIGSDLIRQPGGTGTTNFPSQNGNLYVYPWPAGTQNPGTQPVYDAIAFFKRPNPYMNGIPAGWNSINGYIWDCHSAVESPPSIGSFFAIRVRDINGNIVVDAGYPISVQ